MSARTALTSAMLLAALAGCAVPTSSQPEPSLGTAAPASPFDDIPEEIRVHAPKDARGLRVCDMIPTATLTSIGLRPETSVQTGPLPGDPHYARCSWQSASDEDDRAGIGIRTDYWSPGLVEVYRKRPILHDFEPMVVAGHPAVAARDGETSPCAVDVAIADDQMLSATGSARRGAPCEPSRRLAAAVITNLPPRR